MDYFAKRLAVKHVGHVFFLFPCFSLVMSKSTTPSLSSSLFTSDTALSRFYTWLDVTWVELLIVTIGLPLMVQYPSFLRLDRFFSYMPIIAPSVISFLFSYFSWLSGKNTLKYALSLAVVHHIYELVSFILCLALVDYATVVRYRSLGKVKTMGLFVLSAEYLYTVYYGGQLFFLAMTRYSVNNSQVPYNPIQYFVVGAICTSLAVFGFRMGLPSHADRFIYYAPILTALIYHSMMYILSIVASE